MELRNTQNFNREARASVLTARLIVKMMPCFPWTPSEPFLHHSNNVPVFVFDPCLEITFPGILGKLQGMSRASRERTWLSAAEASVGERKHIVAISVWLRLLTNGWSVVTCSSFPQWICDSIVAQIGHCQHGLVSHKLSLRFGFVKEEFKLSWLTVSFRFYSAKLQPQTRQSIFL